MDVTSVEDLLSCRICMDITQDSIDMTSAFSRSNLICDLGQRFPHNKFAAAVSYLDCFQLCTHIGLPSDEHILMVLCKECADKLITAYECMYKAHSSELILQELSHKFRQLEGNLVNEEEFDKKKTNGVDYFCSSCYDSFPSKKHLERHFSYKICKKSDILLTLGELEKYNVISSSTDDIPKSPPSTPTFDLIKIEIVNEVEDNAPEARNIPKTKTNLNNKPLADLKDKTNNEKLNINSERPTFECDECGKLYFHAHSMLVHKRVHSGDTLPCEVCGKGFVTSKELSVHMRFHNRDFPFVCEICGLKYACMSHLRTHLRKHTGVKLQCDECDKQFQSLKGLNDHRILHTGHVPFPCSYCVRGYPSKHKYKMHLKTVHKVEPTLDEIIRSQKSSNLPRKRLRHTPKIVQVE